MKKHLLLVLGLLLVFGGAVWALEDPLISLSYLHSAFTDQVNALVEARLEKSAQDLPARVAAASGPTQAGLTEISLKEGDILSGATGLVCMPLSGTLALTAGRLVDVTAGEEIAEGTTLTPNHRYLATENTAVQMTVASQTAVLVLEGTATLTYSDAIDYTVMADALKALNLFQGSDTAYGSGYNLDQAPTRLQALVMFLRVMGEEGAALAYTGTHPFQDVRWGDSYVAYAVSKGYTDGVSDDRFGADNPANAVMFMEYLLRAMGYSQVGVDNWETALERAELLGCITAGEYALLREQPFTRAQVAYLSFYSLETPLPTGESLAQRLIDAGVFSAEQLSAARSLVPGVRISQSD